MLIWTALLAGAPLLFAGPAQLVVTVIDQEGQPVVHAKVVLMSNPNAEKFTGSVGRALFVIPTALAANSSVSLEVTASGYHVPKNPFLVTVAPDLSLTVRMTRDRRPENILRDDDWPAVTEQPTLLDVLHNDDIVTPGTIIIATPPARGRATIRGGLIEYVSDPGFCAHDAFHYRLSTGYSVAHVGIDVASIPATALDLTASTVVDTPVTIPVSAGGMIGAVVLSCGSANCTNTETALSYKPPRGFVGQEIFTYDIKATCRTRATGRVTVSVAAPAVRAPDYEITTSYGRPAKINLLDKSQGPNEVEVSLIKAPNHGVLTMNSSGVAIFQPGRDCHDDEFTYKLRNRYCSDASGTVTLHVERPPLRAQDDAVSVVADDPIGIPVLENDEYYRGETPIVQIGTKPASGTAEVAPDGAVIYRPRSAPAAFAADKEYSDSFGYQITDTCGSTAHATVKVTVRMPTPHAVDDVLSTTYGAPIQVEPLLNDSAVDAHVTSVGSPAELAGDKVTYRPPRRGDNGKTVEIPYSLADRFGSQASAKLRITINPLPFEAVDDTGEALPETPTAIDVIANDRGADLKIGDVQSPSTRGGTVTRADDRHVTYKSAHGTTEDTFTYTLVSGKQTDKATVHMKVVVPDVIAVEDTATTDALTEVAIPVLRNDHAEEPIIASFTLQTENGGTVREDHERLVYKPPGLWTGTDVFKYTINDRYGSAASASVSVAVVKPPLHARNDTVTCEAEKVVNIPVLANDAGAQIKLDSIVPGGMLGSATISGNQITYTAPPKAGDDTFEYVITDAFEQQDKGVVTVKLRLPALTPNSFTIATEAGATKTVNVISAASGVLPKLVDVAPAKYGEVTFTPQGQITYSARNESAGQNEALEYTIRDKYNTEAKGTVSILIIQVQPTAQATPPPSAVPPPATPPR